MKCGKPLKGGIVPPQTTPMRWEYKDLVIRLNDIKVRDNREEGERATTHINNLIVENLRHEGQSGWQAEGLTDFTSLLSRNGAVDIEYHGFLVVGYTGRMILAHVRV